MKKQVIFSLLFGFLCFFAFTSKAEAKTHVSFNFGALFAPPTPVYERYVVAPAPVVAAPVYVYPEGPVVYVAPRPVYREVYVAPRPHFYQGFSFGWYR